MFASDRALQLTSWFGGVNVPLGVERVRLLNEVGNVLKKYFEGKVSSIRCTLCALCTRLLAVCSRHEVLNLIQHAGADASRLVDVVAMWFPGFRDSSVYKGHQVFFYKRAQILVADVWGSGVIPIHNIEKLTMFADYRVPQILHDLGVLVYSEQLHHAVVSKQQIPPGSEQECEIRAWTVVAVDLLREALLGAGRRLTAVELDWLLWTAAEARLASLPPHHRTLTVFY